MFADRTYDAAGSSRQKKPPKRGVWINAVSRASPGTSLDKTTTSELLDGLSADEAFGRATEPCEEAATIAACGR